MGIDMGMVKGVNMGMEVSVDTSMGMSMSSGTGVGMHTSSGTSTGMDTIMHTPILEHACHQGAQRDGWLPHATAKHRKARGEDTQRIRLTRKHMLMCHSRACHWQRPRQPLVSRRLNEKRAPRRGMAVGAARGSGPAPLGFRL